MRHKSQGRILLTLYWFYVCYSYNAVKIKY